MMSALRAWGNDISGSITTTGTSTAYAVATGQSFDTLAHLNGQMVAFVPHTTNGATVTLNVDGTGAKPLRSSPGVELQGGSIIQGTPYVAFYNNSDGAFYLFGNAGLAGANSIPVGGLMPYVGTTAPNSGFALPYGQAVSRTTYATLFALVSTTFGSGDGSTTFNVPDLRGRSIFGLDNMGGSAASRITVAGGNFDGTSLGMTGGGQNHALTTNELPTFTPSGSIGGSQSLNLVSVGPSQAGGGGGGFWTNGSPSTLTILGSSFTFTGNSVGGGAAHTSMPPAMVLPFILRVI